MNTTMNTIPEAPALETVAASTLHYVTLRMLRIPEHHLSAFSRVFIRKWGASYVLQLIRESALPVVRHDGLDYAVTFTRNVQSTDALRALVTMHPHAEVFLHFRAPRRGTGHCDHTPRVLINYKG